MNDSKNGGTGSANTENSSPKSAQDEIEFQDDWETDDDSIVLSMRSKSSMVTTTQYSRESSKWI